MTTARLNMEIEITSANCLHCGKAITNPDSLKLGIGPECMKKFWKSKTTRKVGIYFLPISPIRYGNPYEGHPDDAPIEPDVIQNLMEDLDIMVCLGEDSGYIFMRCPKFTENVAIEIEKNGKLMESEVVDICEIICIATSTPEVEASDASNEKKRTYEKNKIDNWLIQPNFLACTGKETWATGYLTHPPEDFVIPYGRPMPAQSNKIQKWRDDEWKTDTSLLFQLNQHTLLQEPVIRDMKELKITWANSIAQILAEKRIDDLESLGPWECKDYHIDDDFVQRQTEVYGQIYMDQWGYDPFEETIWWNADYRDMLIEKIPCYICKPIYARRAWDLEYHFDPYHCGDEDWHYWVGHVLAQKYKSEYEKRIKFALGLITELRPDEIEVEDFKRIIMDQSSSTSYDDWFVLNMVLSIQDEMVATVEEREPSKKMSNEDWKKENQLLRKQMASMEQRIIDLERSIDAALQIAEANTCDAWYWNY